MIFKKLIYRNISTRHLPVNFISIAKSVKRISVDFFNDSNICIPTVSDTSNLIQVEKEVEKDVEKEVKKLDYTVQRIAEVALLMFDK
jgi:hypothetical protein